VSDRTNAESGVSMLELLLGVAFLLPLLLGAVQLTQTVGKTVDSNATSSQCMAQLQRAFQTTAEFAQSCKMSTLRMRAVASDVALGLASAVGEWIEPSDLVWRPGLRFLSASGLLSMNARLSTSQREIDFVLDPGEVDNDLDDDGDGMVDEGQIVLLHEGTRVAVLPNVEHCQFMLEGRVLQIRIGVARRGGDGGVERAVLQRSVFLRNN